MNEYKKMFPMFINNKDIVYFDNAALGFKPYEVLQAGFDFYEKFSISTRTADSKLGIFIASQLANIRKNIANFVDANENELIFSSGTTESLNLIASMLSETINEGEIILSYYNHSSNIVPFLEQFKNKNIKFIYTKNNEEVLNNINKNTKIVALPQKSNTFEVDFDFDKIYKKCKENNAILINDAAQAVVHEKVSLKNSDVIAFSANKIYGPTGIGALVIKEELINKLLPKKWGGGQVQDIYGSCHWDSKPSIIRFEPGTQNFAGIFQFNAAIEFVKKLTYKKINELENEIYDYLILKLKELSNVEIDKKSSNRIVLFNLKNIPSQDVASYLGHQNIYVRSGVFCAHKFKELPEHNKSYIRVSISFYNDKEDVDILINTLKKMGDDYLGFL
ncbi:aminotransferase class V-fold PLP-dependent enzyme [Mycoplasma struthionis]|uniref:Aminotransferase class V-fold PLP-dependent enzyme n=1 Tax=Mycoplasma struthionis TaxID=538220 RepID=A0A502M1G2_9MOLU|nr:aminotransferase class V-fold PLP-dependent enzyme [Mycoplasma struthionis]TPI01138.1 aminotransferase class V-fold PLP-dependent enzyme [Mycoplasma struthionis]